MVRQGHRRSTEASAADCGISLGSSRMADWSGVPPSWKSVVAISDSIRIEERIMQPTDDHWPELSVASNLGQCPETSGTWAVNVGMVADGQAEPAPRSEFTGRMTTACVKEFLLIQSISFSPALNLVVAPLSCPFYSVVGNPIMGLAGKSPIPD
jgi:hypothetical protein